MASDKALNRINMADDLKQSFPKRLTNVGINNNGQLFKNNKLLFFLLFSGNLSVWNDPRERFLQIYRKYVVYPFLYIEECIGQKL